MTKDKYSKPHGSGQHRETRSSSRSRAAGNNGEIVTQNRFAPLSEITEHDGTPTPPLQPKTTPIIIKKYGETVTKITERVSAVCKSSFSLKHLGDAVSVRTTTQQDFQDLKEFLKTSGINFHSFTPKGEKNQIAVLKGLPAEEWNTEDIQNELLKHTNEVTEVIKMTTRNMDHYPMYMVKFKPTTKFPDIHRISTLFYIRIYWDKYKPRDRTTQCYRCQTYGHGQKNCNEKAFCLKCGKQHETKDCQKPKDLPPTCALCQGEHLSNSRKCPKFKEYRDKIDKNKIIKKTPSPVFIEEDFPALQPTNHHTQTWKQTHQPPQASQNSHNIFNELKETMDEIKNSPNLRAVLDEMKQLAAILKIDNEQDRRNAIFNFLSQK